MPRPDAPPPVDLAALDLGHLALFVGYAFSDAVMAALATAGFADLRFSHGFLVQHLIDGPRSIGALAERMEITQQGASKVVAELESLGYVERIADPDDARVRHVQLSPRGREAVATTRRVRERLSRKLNAQVGDKALADCRRTLAAALDQLGGAGGTSLWTASATGASPRPAPRGEVGPSAGRVRGFRLPRH
jgi:DNA-binding MarR family transcriptional regulator